MAERGKPQRKQPTSRQQPAHKQPTGRPAQAKPLKVQARREPPRPPSGGFINKLIKGGVALVVGFCLVTMGMHSMNVKKEDGSATWPWGWTGEDWKNWATFTRKTTEDLRDDIKDKVTSIEWQQMWDGLWKKGENLGDQIKDRLARLKKGSGGDVAKAEPDYEVKPSDGKQRPLWGKDPTAERKRLERERQAELERRREEAEAAEAKGETYVEPPPLAPLPTVEEIAAEQAKAAPPAQPAGEPIKGPSQPAADEEFPPEYVEAYETFLEGLEHFKNARKDSRARARARERFERALDLLNLAIEKKPAIVDDPLCTEVQQYMHDCIKDAKVGDY